MDQQYSAMVKGMLSDRPDRLLEWYMENGGRSLYRFLGKPLS